MSGRLTDRCAVVTGVSSGIGRAIAERFVAEGALVVGASRREPDLAGASWVATDVAESGQVRSLMEAAIAAHGRLDVVVNNAGVQLEKTVEFTTDEEFDQVMGVNVRGVFNCCRAAIPHLRASGGGAIVNIGSTAGFASDHGMAVYNASKAAVHGLTRAIATDHGRDGIRCNAISPGWILTDMAEAAFAMDRNPEAAKADAIATHPVQRLGTPDDVASLAVWLASDESGFATGALFTLDGGLTAQSPIGADHR